MKMEEWSGLESVSSQPLYKSCAGLFRDVAALNIN